MTGFSFYNDERTDITHVAGAAAKDVLLPRFQKNLFAMTCLTNISGTSLERTSLKC